MRRRTTVLVGLFATTMIAGQAFAQDVVMRRPLPHQRGITSGQDGCELTGTCPTPTPTPGSTPTPTPTPTPDDPWEPPVTPDDGAKGYGYFSSCPVDLTCYEAQYNAEINGSYMNVVDESLCRVQQSDEAIKVALYSGMIPGGPDADPSKVCDSPTNIYGWGGFCWNGPNYYCGSLDPKGQAWLFTNQPDSKCESYVPDEASKALMAKFGLMSNADKIANPLQCDDDGTDPDPDPDPDPTDPTDPNDPDNPTTDDPTIHPDDPDPDPESWGFYTWEVGPWSGGNACGEQSHMTRSVRCVMHVPDWGGEEVGFNAKKDGVMQVSFQDDADKPQMSHAIWDPATKVEAKNAIVTPEEQGRLILAQMMDFPTTDTYVSYETCLREIGLAPGNTYDGDKANCDYQPEKVSDGTWTHPWGGDATCSADAVRYPEYRCVDASNGGVEVPLGFCFENIRNGGERFVTISEGERGNFSGCTAEWRTETYELGCHETADPNSPNGPIRLQETYSYCERSDGTVLEGVEEAACPISDRPLDGINAVGSCYKTFDQSVWDGVCYGHKPGGYSTNLAELDNWRTVIFPGYMSAGGAKACVESGATCCQERFNYTTGQVETVGSNKPIRHMSEDYSVPSGGRGIYMDDGVGPIQNAGTVTYPAGSDERVLDHASPVRITGSRNGYTCPYEVGTVMAGCGSIDFLCRTEPGYEGWPPPLMKCNPSTMYYQYEQMHRIYPQGGSEVKWSINPPRSQ